jgi:hypothetical protein
MVTIRSGRFGYHHPNQGIGRSRCPPRHSDFWSKKMSYQLTPAQSYMLESLQLEPRGLDHLAMSINFGRKWNEPWSNLERKGLVEFAIYAKDARHYRAKRENR